MNFVEDAISSTFIALSFQNSSMTHQQTEALRITAGTTAILSMVGSLFIIFSSLLFGDLFKSLANRLIMYLSFADLIAGSSYIIRLSGLDLMDSSAGDMACKAEAFLMTTFEMSSVFWSSCICMHLLLSIMLPDWRVERMEPVYHVVSWGYPILWSSIVLGMNRFGRASNWCWLIPDEPRAYFSWRFFTFLPVYVLMFFNIAVYIGVCVSLRRMLRQTKYATIFSSVDRRKELKALRQLSIIMIAFFITWIPPMANRLTESLNPLSVYFWLDMAQAITNPLQGFWNVVLYGYRFVPRYYRAFKNWKSKWVNKRIELNEKRNDMEKKKRNGVLSENDALKSNDLRSLSSIGSFVTTSGWDDETLNPSSESSSVNKGTKLVWSKLKFWTQYYCLCVCCPCGIPDKKHLSSMFSSADNSLMFHPRESMSFLRPPSLRSELIHPDHLSESETDDEDGLPFLLHHQNPYNPVPTPDRNRHRPYISESSASNNIAFVPNKDRVRTMVMPSSISPQTPPKYYLPDSIPSSFSSPDRNRHQYDGVSSLAESMPLSHESRHSRFMFNPPNMIDHNNNQLVTPRPLTTEYRSPLPNRDPTPRDNAYPRRQYHHHKYPSEDSIDPDEF